jgi:hypothetical protein
MISGSSTSGEFGLADDLAVQADSRQSDINFIYKT